MISENYLPAKELTIDNDEASKQLSLFTKLFFGASANFPANVFFQAAYIARHSQAILGYLPDYTSTVDQILQSPDIISRIAELGKNAHRGTRGEEIVIDANSLGKVFKDILDILSSITVEYTPDQLDSILKDKAPKAQDALK